MLIALFGGTFDPPHKGHELVANTLINKNIVDEVWFVPVFEHPWADRYQKQLTSYDDRVAMLELVTNKKTRQRITHFKDVSFTFNTLQYFSAKYPEHDFFWIMGSEYLTKYEDFLTEHPQLMEFPFLVYPREGYGLEPVYGNMLVLNEVPTIKISSTDVRERLTSNKSITDLVNSNIDHYINKHSLYTKDSKNRE